MKKNDLKNYIKESIFDFFKNKKQEKNKEIKDYINNQINYFRLHSDEKDIHDRNKVMDFMQKLIHDVNDKYGKICVPSIDKEQIEDIVGSYLQKYKII